MKLQKNKCLNKVIKNNNKNTTTKNSEKSKIKVERSNMRKNLKLDNIKKIKKCSKESKSTKNALKCLNNKEAPPKKEKMELKNHKKISDEHSLHKNITHKKSSKNNFNNILINTPDINTSKIKSANEKIESIYYSKKDKTRDEDKKKNAELYIYSNTKRTLYLNTNDFNKGKELDNNKIKNNKNDFKNLNDQELNNLEYIKAIKYDKRTYFQYYWSLLKKKHLLLFTFIPTNDYNLFSVKIALFIISFSLYLTINGFFFNDNTMHKVYIDNGAFNLIYQVPQILYSSIISAIINIILKQLSLSEKNILELKNQKDLKKAIKKSKKISICLKLKSVTFFIFSMLLILFFWYFISCFCAVYINTQKILLKDTLISFCLSMIYPFGLNLLPGIFRISALRAKERDQKCLYKASLLIALI